jgi:uncharacterized protein YegP (UPF0339 family)
MLIFKDLAGEWRWRFSISSDITADSGEGYASKANAKRAAEDLVIAMAGPIRWTFDKAKR